MRNRENIEDSQSILSERWREDESYNKARDRPWEMWGIAFICLISGIAIGTLFGNSSPGHEKATKPQAYNGTSVPAAPFGLDLPVTFWKNELFEKDGGPEADAIWEQLLPLGRGFVQVDSEGNAISHNGKPSDLSQTKVVSVFHQLHCLNNLRKSLFAFVDDYESFKYMVPQLQPHWKHCFDYLRQALMCNADVTFENLERSAVDNRSLASVDGWGTQHLCRDWGKLFEWTEENRATDDDGID